MEIGMTGSTSKVSIIVPNWNGLQWLENCLNSLKIQDYGDSEIIVVDDASIDGSTDYLEREFPEIKTIKRRKRGGFAKAVNEGIAVASGEYIVLLNNDTVASSSFIENLVRIMDTSPPEVGCLAGSMRTMSAPLLIDDAGDILTWYGQALKRGHGKPVTDYMKQQDVLSACAGAALYRRGFLDSTGGFDERFVNYLEDVDLGLRGRLSGYRCIYVPDAEVLHKGHGSALPSGDYIRFVTRNRLMLFGKNIPFSLLIRHLHHILVGQVALFFHYRHPFASLTGYASFLPEIPHVLKERRRILAGRAMKDDEIEELLIDSAEGISLPRWLSGSNGGKY